MEQVTDWLLKISGCLCQPNANDSSAGGNPVIGQNTDKEYPPAGARGWLSIFNRLLKGLSGHRQHDTVMVRHWKHNSIQQRLLPPGSIL